ncbi:MAG: 3-phosphoshikimate 1-carboxyvinyltransferase [Sphingomonadaceae bacterium]
MSAMVLTPAKEPLSGRITLPGSKSITNRALLLAGLARGTSHLSGALKSDDTLYMAAALRQMGVTVDEPDTTSFVVTGQGRLQPPAEPLFLGNAGTATRFLTAAAAGVDGKVVIDGDAHMRKRPIAPLVRALQELGVTATATGGCPPVTVYGGQFPGGIVHIDAGLSSQYVSALLMAAACASGSTDVVLAGAEIGARGYVDLTLAVMRAFGATVQPQGDGAWRVQPTGYRATDYAIEPDASAATYIWAANALTGGNIDIGLAAENFTQPDATAYALIRQFPHLPSVIDGAQIQDAVPTLAVLAALNQTPVRFTGIANLRVKETDRIRALATELNRIRPGLAHEDRDDLLVNADPAMAGGNWPADIETYADHRIAMSFALLGLRLHGIRILDPGCVAKTWPGYWQTLAATGAGMREEVA